MAYHGNAREDLKQQAVISCNANPMSVCKAFYTQTRWATAAEASQVAVPVLLLHGASDGVVPVSGAEALGKALPHAEELRVIVDCAHQLFEEKPKDIASEIEAFLKRCNVLPAEATHSAL